MNKKEFEKYLDDLGLDKKEYCIISGGSLLMHNLKEETDDVDLYVTQKSFDKLSKKFNVHISGKPFPNHYTVNEKNRICSLLSVQSSESRIVRRNLK